MFAPYRIAEGRDFEAVASARGGQGYSIPAPIGGLNARDALANMPETDAIILDNWFPQPSWVEIRGGSKTIATFTGACETVGAYNGLLASQLYAAVNNAGTRSIYRVDGLAGGPVGAPVVGGAGGTIQPITSTRYDWAQYGSGAAEILYLVNGVDNPLLYDGTTWYAVTNASVPYALTGVAPNTLNTVTVYKQRLWFTQGGTFNVWYLAQNSIAGALTLLPLAANFMLGGSLVAVVTVSIDDSLGLNDYIAFVSSQGEVVVFQGYDPTTTATFYLVARFRIGHPIGVGRRCWQKLGSDAAILCADGLILMSQALLTDRSQTKNAVSDKIRRAINQAVVSFGSLFGWQVQLHPIGNKLLVNVPTSENLATYSFAMNTLNSSWCTFGRYASSWNAYCYETQGDSLYFGTTGAVKQADTATFDDDGTAIQALVKTAFSYFDSKTQLKRWTMARPVFTVNGTLSVAPLLLTDFNAAIPTGAIPISQGNSAIWNVSLWTTPTYWGDASIISKEWLGIGGLGYCASLALQVAALDVSLQWQSTDFVYEDAGLT